uniref:Uncharacterized protein n=1 Tax=Oryza brachyantha TaxID=4533 RepID=J3LQT4_ORYBR
MIYKKRIDVQPSDENLPLACGYLSLSLPPVCVCVCVGAGFKLQQCASDSLLHTSEILTWAYEYSWHHAYDITMQLLNPQSISFTDLSYSWNCALSGFFMSCFSSPE